ncbi:hypothetical protein OQA88_1924 [Cercophora sp. LCS_1]
MRSQLTRNVYRRLLAGNGLLRPCRAPYSRSFSQCRPRLPVQSLAQHSHRRTFIQALFQKPPREVKEPELEPYYDVLLEFASLETEGARPPPRDELAKGFRQFIQHKWKNGTPLNSTQAYLTLKVLRHLSENVPGESTSTGDLSSKTLRQAMGILRTPPRGDTSKHLELARFIYEELQWRKQAIPDEIESRESSIDGDFRNFIEKLTLYGASSEAVERFDEVRRETKEDLNDNEEAVTAWAMILKGLAKEGLEKELLAEFEKVIGAGIPFTSQIHETMTGFFTARDRVEEAKRWFEMPLQGQSRPTAKAYLDIAQFSLRTKQTQWCQPVFETLEKSLPDKSYWFALFYWAVLGADKGVEDIRLMIEATSKGASGSKGRQLSATITDALLSAAIEKKNPYLAERFLSLTTELGIPPRASTYILQMNYRLDAQDFSGAEDIYKKLQNREIDVHNDQDLPVINKYLRLLCEQAKPDMDRILDVTANVELRHKTFEPETTVALCLAFLRGDQQFDIIDTLSLHTPSLSIEERAQIRKAFVQYCLDKKVSTARVWDAYSLLRQFFPETEPEARVRLMEAFFDRRRPDMACYIFGHMRGHGNPAQRPTTDTYVRCLEGLGSHPDLQALKMIHNMLKMDTTVEMDTRVRNALMLAYASCGQAYVALEFWKQIAGSTEGPSYKSLEILFWACEKLQSKNNTAKEVWLKMSRMDLEVPPNVFWAYCGAIAGQGLLEEVKRLIGGMEASVGYSPTYMTLGVTYNAFQGPKSQLLFEEWAKEEYPELWAKLVSKGRRKTLNGPKFNIVRNMEA